MKIELVVNSRRHQLEIDPNQRLLSVLRDVLGLTGAKNGCSQGHCGACTVVVNGKATRSCLAKVEKLNDAEIITIEGLAKGTDLHPIQQAFVEATAVQCGFCTPGIIMELYALFLSNPDAAEDEIRSVLEKHLCRCTGYNPILNAAKLSQELLREKSSPSD